MITMGKTGRLISEREWPFQADWYSMLFSVAGTGFVLERGDECAPIVTQNPRTVEVKSGYVISPTGKVRYFPGDTIKHDGNPGKNPRLDLLYLVEDSEDPEKMELVMEKGKSAERPKAPQLPQPDEEKVVPIAVVGFQEYTEKIHDLFDARSVLDSEHHHGAGEALELDEAAATMDLKTDDETLELENGELQMVDGAVSPGDMNIRWKGGLEEKANGNIRVKAGYGLRFDHQESVEEGELKLWFDADEAAGAGLGEAGSSGQLEVIGNEGIEVGPDGIRTKIGDGFKYEAEKLTVETVTDGGIAIDEDGRLFVDPNDFVSGNALGVNEDLNIDITSGTGISVGTYVDADVTDGLRIWSEKVEIRTGYGVEFNSNGEVRLDNDELVGDIEGEGLYTSGGKLHVGAYDGLRIDGSDQLAVDGGEGITVGPDGVGLNTDDETIEVYEGELRVLAAGISGSGFRKPSGSSLSVDRGDGIRTRAGTLGIYDGDGITFEDELPKVDRDHIFGDSIDVVDDKAETDFFSAAFEKVDYSGASGTVIDAGDPTNYAHATVGLEHEGKDIWIFPCVIYGQEDDHRNQLEVYYEQGAEGHDWWSTIALTNVGGQDGAEEGEIWIKYLALTPKWMKEEVEVELEIEVIGEGSSSPSEGIHTYSSGKEITLSAVPGANYEFSHWGGDIYSESNPEHITITEDMYIECHFAPEGIE